MLTHVWIIPLIPALSFVAILAVGKKLPKKGAEIGIASVAICLVLAVTTGIGWINRVNHPPEVPHGDWSHSAGSAIASKSTPQTSQPHTTSPWKRPNSRKFQPKEPKSSHHIGSNRVGAPMVAAIALPRKTAATITGIAIESSAAPFGHCWELT